MRTRSRSNRLRYDNFNVVNRFTQTWYNNSNGQVINSYFLPNYEYTAELESDVDFMVDDPTRKSKISKEVLHSTVLHRKMESHEDVLISGNDKFVTQDNGGNSAHWRVWGNYGRIYPENISIQWDVSDHDLALQARHDFFQTNDVDTLLNLVEAPDFVTGLKSMHSNVNVPVVPSSKFNAVFKAKKLTKFISGGFLYYSFGIAPLISDMKKLSKATTSYSRKLKQTLQSAGTAVSVHRKCGGTFLNALTPSNGLPLPAGYGALSNNGDGSHWHASVQPMIKPVKTVTIRGIRHHKYFSPLFQQIDDLANRFGSVGPASFAWERLPFSFVVDWFVDGADVFDRLDNFLTGSRKKIQDATISYKWGCAAGVVKHKPAATVSTSYDGLQTAVNELSYYHRKPIEAGLSTGLSGRFGKRQVALTAALLGQMATNLKLKR